MKYFRALKEKQYIKVSVFYFCYCDNRILSADLNLTIEKEFFYKSHCSVASKYYDFDSAEQGICTIRKTKTTWYKQPIN